MADNQNKIPAQRLWKAFETGDLDDLDSFVAAEAVVHNAGDPFGHLRGPEHVRQLIEMYRSAFSGLRATIRLQIAEGDHASTLLEVSGDNTGELMGQPATGRHASVLVTQTDRVVDGKIAESWSTWDVLSMLQQLGLAQIGAHPATA